MPDHPRAWLARRDVRDLATGVLLALVAAGFAVSALRNLALGTPASMGPGFFPLMVATVLMGVALAIMLRGARQISSPIAVAGPRALLCVLSAPAVFGLAVAPLGFVPAIAVATFVAAWGSRRMTVRFAVLLTAGLTALCATVFVYLLRMPVRLFGPWLGF